MSGLSEQIAVYCTYLDTERNVSPHTLAAYRRDLEQLALFVARETGAAALIGDVDHLLLRRYPPFVTGGALPAGQIPVFCFHSLEPVSFERKRKVALW